MGEEGSVAAHRLDETDAAVLHAKNNRAETEHNDPTWRVLAGETAPLLALVSGKPIVPVQLHRLRGALRANRDDSKT
eukprot:3929599-Amphidinium_carterae.1